jgi:tRNA A-37 threonylcarbamoyl transferase component Bud32
MTSKLHNAGFSFIDNKAQNYLVKDSEVYRTDLGLIQSHASIFTKSLDIGLFLASLVDFNKKKYKIIENLFLEGYKSQSNNRNIPLLSIIIRNIASLGLASNHFNMLANLMTKSEI